MCGYSVAASVLVCLVAIPSYCNSDNNQALLLRTLKTMQRAACDDETVSLSCPRGTSVSIQLAQYGKTMDAYSCMGKSSVGDSATGANDRCLLPNSMQYSLLQTVIEVCQKRPNCRFTTKPGAGQVDPCPGTRKFVEVAYKCSPVEFRKRSVCQDEIIRLNCNPYSRVAIYEAQYGRMAYEPLMCHLHPQEFSNETCLAQFATETVMKMCHGKRRCEVTASSKNFGTLCNRSTKTNLKIAYTCVPLGVLTERYESALENDEMATDEASGHDQEQDLFDENDAGEKWVEPTVIPAAPVANQPFLTTPQVASNARTDLSGESVRSIHNTKINAEEVENSGTYVLMYIGIAIAIFIILTLILIGVRCYIITRSSRGSKSNDMYIAQAPNVFNDTVSDIDNDVEVSHISGTFYEHPDMILYRDVPGNKGTLRAMRPVTTIYPCSSMYGTSDYVPSHVRVDSDVSRRMNGGGEKDTEMVVSPKSLSRYSTPNFYYG